MTTPSATPRSVTARATLLIIFSACCFGSIATMITLATRTGAALVDLLAWRYAVAALVLAAIGGVRAMRAAKERALPLLLLAGGGQTAIAVISLSALRYIPVSTLTFLFYTYPAFVAIIGVLRGTEPLTGRRTLALGLSLGGIALMVGTPGAGGLHPLGVAFALVSALLYAGYIPMINYFGRGLPPAVTAAYASAGAAGFLIVMALFGGGLAFHFAPVAWAMIALLSMLSTVFAFLAFLRGLALIGPVRTAIASTVEPFWAALLGAVVLHEHFGPRVIVGGTLIAAAVILLQMPARGRALSATS